MVQKKESADSTTSAATDVNQPYSESKDSLPNPWQEVNPNGGASPPRVSLIKLDNHSFDVGPFVRFPKWLNTPAYSGLSSDAKLLYLDMLDRLSLSATYGWVSDDGALYIRYSANDGCRCLNCGRTKVFNLFHDLAEVNLIKRVKNGLGESATVYLFQPADIPNCKKAKSNCNAAFSLSPPPSPIVPTPLISTPIDSTFAADFFSAPATRN